MADGLSIPRKLEQISWVKGITDGDIRPGYFSELINVEFDHEERIRCRDGLEYENISIPTSSPCKFIHLNGDPSGTRRDGWNVFITSSTVYVYPFGYDINAPDAATFTHGIEISLNTIDAILVGTTIVISSCNISGDPNHIISIIWNRDAGRFARLAYDVEGSDVDPQINNIPGWGIHDFSIKPVINLHEHTYADRFSRHSIVRPITDFLNANQELGTSIVVSATPKDTVCPLATGYTGQVSIQMCCVFVFVDGSMSKPSNIVTLTRNITEFERYDLSVNVAVHKNLVGSVSGIRVYRKVVTGSEVSTKLFDFLFAALLFDDDINQQTYMTPSMPNGTRDTVSTPRGTTNYPFESNEKCDDYYYSDIQNETGVRRAETVAGVTGSVYRQDYNAVYGRTFFYHLFVGESNKVFTTAGWSKIGVDSDINFFMPPHYYNIGECTFMYSAVGNGINFNISVNMSECIRISDRFNVNDTNESDQRSNTYKYQDGTVIIGSNFCFPFAMIIQAYAGYGAKYVSPYGKIASDNTVWFDDSILLNDCIEFRGYIKTGYISSMSHNIPTSVGTTTTVYNNSPDPFDPLADIVQKGFHGTFAAFRDSSLKTPVPSLEDEFGGSIETNISTVNPRYIGTAGGRLFALNIIEDGSEFTSRLVYTEFGNFSSFKKDNYIDYGIRDDGVGVGISVLKSYIIAHHTSSTYVFDISGGTDFSWREIGAFKDVGCIGNKLISETPFGVFWCDANNIWFYNGGGVRQIADEIIDTYRSNVNNFVSLSYKEDLKQLWLTTNFGTIFVLDINGQRWHTHKIDEFDLSSKIISSVFNVNGVTVINFVDSDYTDNSFYRMTNDSTNPFTWSIDTGEMCMNVPEIVKKIRRLYIHCVRADGYKDSDKSIHVEASGDSSGSVSLDYDLVNDNQIRLSTSTRGYFVRFKAFIDRSKFWRGTINSLGVSYKMKNLK